MSNPVTSADAVDREATWLATSGDGLPGLLKTVGGPFDNVQAYMPRTPNTQQRSIFVLRRDIKDDRVANIRRRATYEFVLRIIWPILAGSGSAETEQRNLDAAIELVIQRIVAPTLDKTHGGRFLSVAEGHGPMPNVAFTDPEHTIPLKTLEAEITYSADDFERNF